MLLTLVLHGFSYCHNPCFSNILQHENVCGVSRLLADHRKAILKDTKYLLSFDIKRNSKDSIRATEELSFNLSSIANPLEIDFSGNKKDLKSITVNGIGCEIKHEQEHIIISSNLLSLGSNLINISFIADRKSLNWDSNFVYTLSVPDKARGLFPCFDQPDIKARFSLILTIPADWEAVSNSFIKQTVKDRDRKTCYFNSSDVISTYLFSFVAGQFNRVSKKIDGKEYNFYYREKDTIKIRLSVDLVFEFHRNAIRFMELYTGISFPFQKLDFVAIPNFPFKGMEHVGAIDYNARFLFLDSTATPVERMERAKLIAHETSHMWFGNLVTMKWFNDVWMKEVFANFMADKMISTLISSENDSLQFLLAHFPKAYNIDRTPGSNPIRQELLNLNQSGTLYNEIIYDKAPIVFRHLSEYIGEGLFQEGLKEYLRVFSYQNSDWNDLITILMKVSHKDINSWNQQWINKAGRPVILFKIQSDKGVIKSFEISQNGEYDNITFWEQDFSVGLVYEDHIKEFPVHMEGSRTEMKEICGQITPLFVLFNSTGVGYGLFPADTTMLNHFEFLRSPIMRTSAYINIYEQTLSGQSITPSEFLKFYGNNFKEEFDSKVLDRMAKQFRNIYWQFITPETRTGLLQELEMNLWSAIADSSSKCEKRILFQLYTQIHQSAVARDNLFGIWETKTNPFNIKLNDDDYVLISSELIIRQHPKTNQILAVQLKRLQNNEELKKKFVFSLPALSNKIAVRDSFFYSLSIDSNRVNKLCVLNSLQYLHHPLRTGQSEKYLPETLHLLEKIQQSGDIFFPSEWLSNSLNYYQSKSATKVVEKFLKENPHYNINLKEKILQESDDLFRAQKILGN